MVDRDERLYVADIVTAIDRALQYTPDGRQAFFADPKTPDAVVRNIEIIGEAVKGVSDTTRRAHPEVPWSQIGATSWAACSGGWRSRRSAASRLA